MMIQNRLLLVISFIYFTILPMNVFASIYHELDVEIGPNSNYIRVVDKITIPQDQSKPKISFSLNENLSVVSKTKGVLIELNSKKSDLTTENSVKSYNIELPAGHNDEDEAVFILVYSGKIFDSVKQVTSEYARSFRETTGIISQEGVYLAGSTFWVPWFNDNMVTFSLTVHLPELWDVVSQGNRTIHLIEKEKRKVQWISSNPMDEIFLIAAKFHEYSIIVDDVAILAFLRSKDEKLANKYLNTTGQYLKMYQELLGPYPYKKFALIENFWQTGYGMPSFTLLGSRIIRFPFILHSSYPHELLHNWWGNSVFVDYKTGNWCEGLTVYFADHLIKEQRGLGAEYRSTTLQKYVDYVNANNDFPLSSFRSRRDDSSEAVGYGKSMMMWNMLRVKVGDNLFIKAMQDFYKENRFKRAAYDDIRKSFEKVTKKDFKPFFQQWITGTGAPELKLSNVKSAAEKKEFNLTFTLSQIQPDRVFSLDVPIAVYLEGVSEPVVKNIPMSKGIQNHNLSFSSRPLRIDIDPRYDIFRRLHRNEIPPSFSQAFGSDKVLILLPSKADSKILAAYKQLADSWAKEKDSNIDIYMDQDISTIPSDSTVWILGWKNIHRGKINDVIKKYDSEISEDIVRIDKTSLVKKNNSFAIAVRNSNNPDEAIVWMASDRIDALPGMGRKLPHYGKYSYLAFEGGQPVNIHKGRWPIVGSPLSYRIDQSDNLNSASIEGTLPKRKALATISF